MTRSSHEIARRAQSGSALIYILIAIALLALLTVSFMEPSSQQTQSQNSFKLTSELHSQVEFIRSTVQECVVSFPGGDISIENASGEEDEGADRRYPIKPNSSHLVTPAADRKVSNLRCPGNPGDNANHVALFGGSTGKFLPQPPGLFTDWQWYNGTDGVFIWIETDKTDAYIQTALQKLDKAFAPCEADVIDATGSAVTLDSGATATCTVGNTCFRMWMIMRPASAIFPDENICPGS